MANKTAFAQASLDFIFSPLQISSGIRVVGNVTPDQQYDVAAGVYTPDYTSSFLVLAPWLEVSDPDGILTDADKVLTNIKWYAMCPDGTESLLSSGTDYVIDADGTLRVKANTPPGSAVTYRLEADFLDPRTNSVSRIMETLSSNCENVTTPPRLILDTPAAIMYDPVRDETSVREIGLSLKVGETEVPAANREFVVQKRDSDGVWAPVDGTDIMDYDISLNAAGDRITVDCSLIGKRIDVRVYAKYNPFGSPSAMPINDATPMEQFSVVRHKGKLKGVILGARRFNVATRSFTPELRVKDAKGEIPDLDKHLDIDWLIATGKADGSVTEGPVIATGSRPEIPLSTVSVAAQYGGVLFAKCVHKEPLRALTYNGSVLTHNGKVIVG